MIEQLLNYGFSKSLAAGYITLLRYGSLHPQQLVALNHETRTNAYSLLDKLVELRLAKKTKEKAKILYVAEHPAAFEKLLQQRRDELQAKEQAAHTALPELFNLYQQSSEKPGVRFYQGKTGIKKIFREQIETGKPITYLRTRAEVDLLGFNFIHQIRILAPQAGIHRHVFSPDVPEVPVNWKQENKRLLLTRTWYEADDYTAPVEWSVFGNKVAIISFGKEVMGTIVDSPQIAESVRQLFAMLDKGLKRSPEYSKMPRRAEFTTVEEFTQKHNDKLPE